MTHTLNKEKGTEELNGQAIPLFPAHSILIPALCVGVIPHGVSLDTSWEEAGDESSWVMLVPEPGALLAHGLLIVSGPVPDGDVTTTVFNLTNEEKRLRRTECVSRLVKMTGASWSPL